jgi:hypothetical protein
MDAQTTTLARVFSSENLQLVTSSIPDTVSLCTASHAACLSHGKALLKHIKSNGVYNDALDQQVEEYIRRSRKTVKKINEARTPITKMFDELRKSFTTLENDCDPNTYGSIANCLQAYRNEYAAAKHEEAERKRREEQRRLQAEAVRKQYRADVENDFRAQFNVYLGNRQIELQKIAAGIRLDNYEVVYAQIQQFPVILAADFMLASKVPAPFDVPADELRDARIAAFALLKPSFAEQYNFELQNTRDDILDMLPSKRQELQRMAQASDAEAARLKAEMAAREAEEAKRLEMERQQRAAAEAVAKAATAKQAEMNNLFNTKQVEEVAYQPKMQITKRINVATANAFGAVFAMWWANEGAALSIEELTKIFKRQITFCEKLANDKNNPQFIRDSGVTYVDEVKALSLKSKKDTK